MISATGSHGLFLVGWQLCAFKSDNEIGSAVPRKQTSWVAATLRCHGIEVGLVGIVGEIPVLGLRPGKGPWTIAVEVPDPEHRAPHSILVLQDAAVATSVDYRHWVDVQGRRLSHTMNPRAGTPLAAAPASVMVAARTCAQADA